MDKRRLIEKNLEDCSGILRLRPAWVARDFIGPGKRLGLSEDKYYIEGRGWICER